MIFFMMISPAFCHCAFSALAVLQGHMHLAGMSYIRAVTATKKLEQAAFAAQQSFEGF
jgi:hypothetical protein